MFDRSFTAYSWPNAEFPQMRRASDLLCLAVVAALPSAARAGERVLSYAPVAPIAPIVAGDTTFGPPKRIEPPSGRVCFDAVETRDKIAAHRLAEPLRAMRMGRLQGDALRAKLCRWKPDEFVYEIAVLRRDGRLVHVYMNALNGQSVGDSENR